MLSALAVLVACAAMACPTDATPRAAGTVLIVQGAGPKTQALTARDLSALPMASFTQRQSVSSGQGAGTERSVTFSGTCVTCARKASADQLMADWFRSQTGRPLA